MKFVKLKPQKAKPFWNGHPLVFSGAVANQSPSLETGDWVVVLDANNSYLGLGCFNAHSSYTVRLLALAHEFSQDATLSDVVFARLKQAFDLRQTIYCTNAQTNCYRLCNSEGDHLSGLTIDIYDKYAVISSSAFWVEKHRTMLESLLTELLPPIQILWRSQKKPLAQDGFTEVVSTDPKAGLAQEIEVTENGTKFIVDLYAGQKTGFFLDQRPNRSMIRELSQNKHVLDLCCYTGGFAINAAKGGAASVVGVDVSESAIRAAKRNAELNDCQDKIQFHTRDVKDFLVKEKQQFDLIILDPPKVAPTIKAQRRAQQLLNVWNMQTLALLKPGGMLLTCSCSQALTAEFYHRMFCDLGVKLQRDIRILAEVGPGLDHPGLAAFPSGQYLRAWLLIAM